MTRSLLATLAIAVPALAGPKVDSHGDPLPDGAVVRFGTIRDRIGSKRVLRSFALSPDGKTLAAETRQGITLWDVDTGRVARRLPWRTWQGDAPKFALCFSPDGKSLARMAGRVVALWDLATGEEVFDIDLKEKGKCVAIAFLPGGGRIIAAGEGTTSAFIIDAKTGRLIAEREIERPAQWISLSGRYLVSPAGYGLGVIDAESGKTHSRIPDARKSVQSPPVLSPDDGKAYLADRTGRLRVFDVATGKQLEDQIGPFLWATSGSPVTLTLSPDGAVAYLVKRGRPIHRWDLSAGKWLLPIVGAPSGTLVPHPDGKRLLFLGDDGILRRYDLATQKQLPGAAGFEGNLFAFPSPDGQQVVIESGDDYRPNRLDLFDIRGRPVWSVKPGDASGRPRWSPDGRWLACVGSLKISLREAATANLVSTLRPPNDHVLAGDVFFTARQDHLLAPYRQGIDVATFDLKSGDQNGVVRVGARPVDLSPDGQALVCVENNGGLCLFDRAASRLMARAPRPPGPDRRAAGPSPRFSPDGSYVLTWEWEQARAPTWAPKTYAVLRDPVTLAPRREFEAYAASVLAFSPDGLWLALGHGNGDWTLWDIPTGQRLGDWEGHRDTIMSIGFAGPGRVLTGSADLTALLWDLRPKEKPKKPVWEALTSDDGREVYRAVWALAADPNAPEFLRTKVSPPPAVAADKMGQWIADLSADRFAVREAATKALQEMGRLAEPDLRAARDQAKTEEARTRLDGLLAKFPRERTGTEVLQARAVQALELAGTDAAKKLLAEWSAGPAGARLTLDAKAALGRLAPTR